MPKHRAHFSSSLSSVFQSDSHTESASAKVYSTTDEHMLCV